jgi:hypothetical protein
MGVDMFYGTLAITFVFGTSLGFLFGLLFAHLMFLWRSQD